MIEKIHLKFLLFAGIILLVALFGLNAAVVYTGGYAEGEVIVLKADKAYLMISTSNPSGEPERKLLAVDLNAEKVLWEKVPFGYIENVIEENEAHIISIEGDQLVSRQAMNGKVIWNLDLRSISTTEADRLPDDRSTHKYGRCIQYPDRVDRYDYKVFRNSPERISIFRSNHSGEVRPAHEDWLEINIYSGKLVGKWCYSLCGFSRKSAVIYDMALPETVIFRTNGNAVTQQPKGRSPELEKALMARPWTIFLSGPEWFLMDLTSGSFEKCLLVFEDGRTLPFYGPGHSDYGLKYGQLQENLLRYTGWIKAGSKVSRVPRIFQIEIMDVSGTILAKAEEPGGKNFSAYYLGQGENREIFMLIDNAIQVYSYPDLKKVTTHAIPAKYFSAIQPYFFQSGKVISTGYHEYLLSYVTGGVWHSEGNMWSKKGKAILTFKFIRFPEKKGSWSLKRKVTYRRIVGSEKHGSIH